MCERKLFLVAPALVLLFLFVRRLKFFSFSGIGASMKCPLSNDQVQRLNYFTSSLFHSLIAMQIQACNEDKAKCPLSAQDQTAWQVRCISNGRFPPWILQASMSVVSQSCKYEFFTQSAFQKCPAYIRMAFNICNEKDALYSLALKC